ncbi:roadblock/LC7 domain-containing protein [Streptosporangiaceae bacterium NEAU-GS5]|nr:roadblock/LC7 domain-containing protein [Streptosporangiaceae bacterium NEAU-GS5]
MTESRRPVAPRGLSDLGWLLTDFVQRQPDVRHAIVLSTDGLPMSRSADLNDSDADRLAAVAAGAQSLGLALSNQFGGGSLRQVLFELADTYLIIMAAGSGACLAVRADHQADIGTIAYEMGLLVARVGEFLTAPARGTAVSGSPR